MKRFFFLALAGVILTALPVEARTRFAGTLKIQSASAGCLNTVGLDTIHLVFNPPNLAGNGADTYLSLFYPEGAENYHLASGSLVGNTYIAVQGTSIWNTAYTFAPQMRLTNMSPAVPINTSPTIALVGDAKGWDGTPSCNVHFVATVYHQ